ncbi:hypothetical protein [Wolbachia endosymbiont (group A) of Lasioglossum fulvicorne]
MKRAISPSTASPNSFLAHSLLSFAIFIPSIFANFNIVILYL